MNFGEYIKSKRTNRNFTQAKAAKMFGISLSYLSGIERGIRAAPAYDVIDKMADILELNRKERCRLYDLAAESKKPPTLADDLVEYIYSYPAIRDMLRYSIECNLTEKDWEHILCFIKENYFY